MPIRVGISSTLLLALGGLALAQPTFDPGAVPTPLVVPDEPAPSKPVEPQAPLSSLTLDAAPKVHTVRVPNGGLQPDVIVDSHGTIHLVSLVGADLKACNIEYRTRALHDAEFGHAVRVNSQEGSATGTGAMGGPRIALGKDDAAHIVWIGSDTAEPRGPLDPKARPRALKDGTPLLYARVKGGTATPQRNLIGTALVVDGGPEILADAAGHVLVFANADQNLHVRNVEASRRIFMMESHDNGETFGKERIIQPTPNGVTAHTPPVAMYDSKGRVQMLYRAAGGNAQRNVWRIVSRDNGLTWAGGEIDQWRARSVPSSGLAITQRGETLLGAWMTKDMNIAIGSLGKPDAPATGVATMPRDVGPDGTRRDPLLLTNAKGFTLVAWTTISVATTDGGTGESTRTLCWQIFDPEGKLIKGASCTASDLPASTRASGWVNPDGTFSVIY